MSFCSQGIRHLDHFGFVCREPQESATWQRVCYIFQCHAGPLVDEIMLTLRQAFSVAASPPSPRTQSLSCCPMQQMHQLCERIQGLQPTSAKLELQKHIATLDSNHQASILESALRSKPKTAQEETEVLLSSLRRFYEERQKAHQNNPNGVLTQFAEAMGGAVKARGRSSEEQGERQKRPLSEPLEILWKENALEGSLSLQALCPYSSKDGPTQKCSPSRGYQQLGFRHRASTYSPPAQRHNPRSDAWQESVTSVKPRLRHNSVSTDSPCHGCDVPDPSGLDTVGDSDDSSQHHAVPWRQKIFLRVAASQRPCSAPPRYTAGGPSVEGGDSSEGGVSLREAGEGPARRRGSLVRERWRKAILQQILLLRMEQENQKLQASESDLQNKRLKLGYEELTPCLKDVTVVWEQMLETPGRTKVQFDIEKIHSAVWQGVPRSHRGEIWRFLSEQHLLRQRIPCRHTGRDASYRDLLGQITSQQHAILIDLGRTFPTHPYFSAKHGLGQRSLYNLLKAYSLLDSEVGYCQGLSFVAGVLLLHMDEEEAFSMLTFLMYDLGLRRQYRPDMIILQIQMYQLSRLLHDYHRELYCHLENHNIGPSLYATPWFLTIFSSHFPLGFVARVFDMLFLQGSEAIFKVALSLLGSHKPLIMQQNSLEAIVDFIKSTLPKLGLVQMEKTINQVLEMDLSKQLQAYEVEYHVLQDQLFEAPASLSQQQKAAQLERANRCLRQQNLDLLEELQVAHAKLDSLETNVAELLSREGNLHQKIGALELERDSLLKMVAQLQAEHRDHAPANGDPLDA
ncbi:TBC1 domain family member 1-like isoform X2 [Paramormyrops kingsleyae]